MEDKTFTQDEVNAIVQERLDRAEKRFAEKYEGFMSTDDVGKLKEEYEKQIADLNASITAQNEKYAGFEEQLAEKDTKIKAFETSSIKTRVAHELGLAYDAVNYLQGETEEEIKKSAEGLKSLVGASFVPPLASSEAKMGDSKEVAMKELLHRLKGD